MQVSDSEGPVLLKREQARACIRVEERNKN